MIGGTLRGWVTPVCAGWLVVVATLAGFTLAPMVVGWRPVVVTTGSMAPAIRPADVAVVDPHDRGFTPGRIVVVRRPDAEGGLVIHRVTAVGGDGSLTTKGDANRQADSAPTAPGDVVGTARYVVPSAGWLPVLFRHPGPRQATWALLTALAVAGLLVNRRSGADHLVDVRR